MIVQQLLGGRLLGLEGRTAVRDSAKPVLTWALRRAIHALQDLAKSSQLACRADANEQGCKLGSKQHHAFCVADGGLWHSHGLIV